MIQAQLLKEEVHRRLVDAQPVEARLVYVMPGQAAQAGLAEVLLRQRQVIVRLAEMISPTLIWSP